MIGTAAHQNEASVAISAVGIATIVNLQPDARMAKCRGNVACSVAHDSGTVGTYDFRLIGHPLLLATGKTGVQHDSARMGQKYITVTLNCPV
jgi:hypothetical protein